MKVKNIYGGEAEVFLIEAELFYKREGYCCNGKVCEYNPHRPCFQIVGRMFDSPLPIIIKIYDPDVKKYNISDVYDEVLRLRKLCAEARKYAKELDIAIKNGVSVLQGSRDAKAMESRCLYLRKQIEAIERQVYAEPEFKKSSRL